MPTDRVLLIDDEIEFVEVLAERLRARGLEVEIAYSGMDGVKKSQATKFDAVVLDLEMPGMNGIATLKMLLTGTPDLQVMILTGQATIKTAVDATRLGAVDILEKPLDITTMMEKIREARVRHMSRAAERIRKQMPE